MTDSGPILVKPDGARYAIEEKVAEGGMGVIYRVLDRSLGRTVAMKVCSLPSTSTREDTPGASSARARFLEEAQVTAQLDHPGIVPVHELGVSSGDQAYFTMPLVNGKSLGEVFSLSRRGVEGWNQSRAVAALIKVCQAVAYAHSKGILHRDLKPSNVMVGRFGQVYVLDWGLAKVLGRKDDHELGTAVGEAASSAAPESPQATAQISTDSSLQTEAGLVLGTPAYMPPEQASGRSDAVDERSDVYAIGAMLYELLSGQVPYVPSGARIAPRAILARILEGPPKQVRAIDPTAPRELVAVCEKAMAHEPRERYASAIDLAEDLQAYLDRRVVTAYRTGALAELRAWCVRHRTLLKIAALVAIVSALAFFAFDWLVRFRDAQRLVASARADMERHGALKLEIPELRKAWLDLRMAQRSWAPSWHRQVEIEKHRALETMTQELDSRFNSAVVSLSNALRIAPASSVRLEARSSLEELYFSRYQAITSGETVLSSSQYYRSQLEGLDASAYRQALDQPGRVSLTSEPAGAEVYCFRYVECDDTRLEPRPFDPATRETLGGPFLRVEAILDPEQHQGVFAVGDRILEVRGRPVHTRADLAGALEGLGPDERVQVELERRGSRMQLEWAPFPGSSKSRLKAGSLLVIHEQLGLSFEGYPVDFVVRCRLGETREGKALTVDLPKGSYLLVLRRKGYEDVRFPLVIPWREREETIRLIETSGVPPGFVYVPAGPFSYGGDIHAFQSLERGEAELPGFFIARFEVTLAEYLEFLNDPDVLARTGADGEAKPASKAVRDELATQGRDRLLLVPAQPGTGGLFLERHEGKTWTISKSEKVARVFKLTSPVAGVCQLAALEYAHWRSEKEGKWRYRLPDDLEWEKAARGVDRRSHVWGEYLVWSFCWSAEGVLSTSSYLPPAVGLFSTDESVYGVRDLAGSVEEHTSSKIDPRYATRRGGNWNFSDSQNLRAANRNGRLVIGRGTETGFRLVAELAQ